MDYTESYKSARKEGKGAADSCRVIIRAGCSFDDATAISWKVETGKKSPDFKHDQRATSAWDRGFESKHYDD